jgi:hypothetical protein
MGGFMHPSRVAAYSAALLLAATVPQLGQARELVGFSDAYSSGTVVVKTSERALYYVLGSGKAVRYPVGVGRAGKQWTGTGGVVVQMAGHEPHIDGRSVIAAIPLNPGATLSAIVSPASPAVSPPDNRRDSASPPNTAQAAPVDAITIAVIAPATTAVTELPRQPVAAPKKSQTARSQNRRDRGWYEASEWRRYGHERPSSSW